MPSALGPMSSSRLPPRLNDIHQHQYQFAAGVIVLDSFGAIEAVAEAHAAALFPGVRGSGHSGRVLGVQ